MQENQVTTSHKIQLGENILIGPNERCFIIAEIGQNHQGNIETAKTMILSAKSSGADCVKFQKTHLPSKFNKQALLRPYAGPNSWGDTYGAHKEFLEFSNEEFSELKKFSELNGIMFSSSAMDETSLTFLDEINVPFIKIGSGDFHNKILLKKAASLGRPLIISTGMSAIEEVVKNYNLVKAQCLNFCLLHCVSSYPVPTGDVNLNVIKTFQKLFPDISIGYSSHDLGIDVPLAAVALGVKIIEKHFTLNKSLKGSDHICSLTPDEFSKMVSNIRKFEAGIINPKDIFSKDNVFKALGSYEKKFLNCEVSCYEKLGKSVVAKVKLQKGDIITWDNICLKVAEPKGVPAREIEKIMQKKIKRNINEDESILHDDLEE